MSDSVRPHRRQPTRLPRPWDSLGKNTGVGCHFLLQCMNVKSESEVTQSCPTLGDPMDCSLPGSSVHGICQVRVLEWGAIAFSGSQLRALIFQTRKSYLLQQSSFSPFLDCETRWLFNHFTIFFFFLLHTLFHAFFNSNFMSSVKQTFIDFL